MPNPTGINGSSPGKGGGSGRGKGPKKKKGPVGGPSVLNVTTGAKINRTDAAAKMYGAGSKQHLAAQKRFG